MANNVRVSGCLHEPTCGRISSAPAFSLFLKQSVCILLVFIWKANSVRLTAIAKVRTSSTGRTVNSTAEWAELPSVPTMPTTDRNRSVQTTVTHGGAAARTVKRWIGSQLAAKNPRWVVGGKPVMLSQRERRESACPFRMATPPLWSSSVWWMLRSLSEWTQWMPRNRNRGNVPTQRFGNCGWESLSSTFAIASTFARSLAALVVFTGKSSVAGHYCLKSLANNRWTEYAQGECWVGNCIESVPRIWRDTAPTATE